jgi:predicted peptidase
MITTTLVFASVLLAAPRGNELVFPKGFVELFQSFEYRAAGLSEQEPVRYRLFIPRNPRPGEKYPLLVWLHGANEGGSDNRKNLRWLNLILDDPAHAEKYRFFVLAVQHPLTQSSDMTAVVFEILEKTMREQSVDADRVYLSGVSSGGSECWRMALRHPSAFAAVVPLGAGGDDASQAASLVEIPIWAFHNRDDENTSPEGVRAMVAAIEEAGGNAHLTLLSAGGHYCWQQAFVKYEVMAWMLDQRRGAWVCWTPPDSRSWRWWHVFAVPGAFVVLLAAGWHSERQRRRRRRNRAATCSPSEAAYDDST